MNKYIYAVLLIQTLFASFVAAIQNIPVHSPEYHYQLIQPHEVASNYQILKLTDEVLHKNFIPYWAWGGTLLGATRHHGFFPWDFDSDICLFEEDLNRFLACAEDLKKYDAYILPLSDIAFRIKRIKDGKEIYGHVDVSFMHKDSERVFYSQAYKNHYFLNSEINQLVRIPFGPIFIDAPAEYLPYLKRAYGEDVMEMAEIMYTENPKTGKKYVKFKLTNFEPAIYEVIDPSIPLDNTQLFP